MEESKPAQTENGASVKPSSENEVQWIAQLAPSFLAHFYTAELLSFHAECICHSSIRVPINSGFSETAAWIQVKFQGKLPIRGPMQCICRLLFMSDSLSSIQGHSVHFAKFPMLIFSKGYCSHRFYPISTKLYGKHGNQVGIQAIDFWGSRPSFKNIHGTLTISHLSYSFNIRKLYWFLLTKGQTVRQDPWVSCVYWGIPSSDGIPLRGCRLFFSSA